ncbi:TraR/DksA C4-type zinc finger protein [Neisseriaceae bacterium JH1-16]|nr:TraR/DksA C4-type zinc finger protein [Neisseriaceae bacterium JH1-16]
MTDIFDRAQELEQLQRDAALANRSQMPAGPSYSHCEDCGDDIPAARQLAAPGCHRCIACQQAHERGRA